MTCAGAREWRAAPRAELDTVHVCRAGHFIADRAGAAVTDGIYR